MLTQPRSFNYTKTCNNNFDLTFDNSLWGKVLKSQYTILIADRNSHIREFLRREMSKEGFRILQAEKGKDVINIVYQCCPPDLVLVDPDLPDMKEALLLEIISLRSPPMPVIIHAFDSMDTDYFLYLKQSAFVEKGAQSVEKLKQVVFEILGVEKC